MKPEVLRDVLTKILQVAQYRCVVAFQGGEPTLAGLPFFKQVVSLEKELNVNNCQIENAIQTNGFALDADWCSFFKENNFLVGVSLDGNKAIHDANRVDQNDRGTYAKVAHSIQLLKNHKVDFNILTVVTKQTCLNIRDIYHFFIKNGFGYMQFIPCLDPLGEKRGSKPWSLTPELYERFLKDLFDCWYADAKRGNVYYIRYFENLLTILNGQRPEACGMLGQCSNQIVVEADGSVYPCDFYALDEWKIGNFTTDSFEEIEKKRAQVDFIGPSRIPAKECLDCKWGWICRGGCRRDRSEDIKGPLSKNYFCSAYKNFFEYAYPRLEEVLQILARQN
jgi:uncharacterized protein